MIKKLIIMMLVLGAGSLISQGKITRSEGLKRSALTYMKAGRYGEAVDLMNEYITANPQEPEGYQLRGMCYENRQQYEWARVDYRRAIKLDRNRPKYYADLNRLTSIWYPKLYEKINGYRREIAIDASDPKNYLGVADCYRLLEEWQDSENWYDRYVAMDPDASPDEIIRYANVMLWLKHISKGEKVLRKWVDKHPTDWRLWSRHGWFAYWLNRYKDAQNSFENALSYKPFFKEAVEGLELAKKEGFLVTLTAGNEYIIDKYFRLLRYNPNDDETRFKLIEELLNVERFEEAIDQLIYLEPNYEGTERFDSLYSHVKGIREATYQARIDDLLTTVENDPTNRNAVKAAADYYAKLGEYENAEIVLVKYLDLIPEDDEVHFIFAKLLSYEENFADAYLEVNKALEINPSKPEYNLLAGQLGTWLDDDLDRAETRLLSVLDLQPKNLTALLTLGTLNFQQQDYDVAEVFIDSAAALSADNPDVVELTQMIELQKLRNEEARLLNNLDQGRQMVESGDCENGVPYYLEYLESYPDKIQVRKELADVYLCLKQFEDAITVYDDVLAEDYNYEIDKMRAKVYLWAGDSVKAVDEFSRLVEDHPDDLEAKLYLGDSFVEMKDYAQARTIYESLVDTAPTSYMIDQRLGWLPPEPVEPGSLESYFNNLSYTMLSYANLYPVVYFFNDNLGFNYVYAGSGLEFGLLTDVAGGVKWLRGSVSGGGNRFNFNQFMGQLFLNLSEEIRLNLGYGQMTAPLLFKHPVLEATLNYLPAEKKNYGANLSYVYGDASTILYSPYLIRNRLSAHNIKLDGFYELKTGLRISGYYQVVYSEPGKTIPANVGNIILARVGRKFLKDLMMGYEYNYIDYVHTLRNLYYSPQEYVSHSVFADWFVIEKKNLELTVGGKIGYVPASDFLIREGYVKALYKIWKNLQLTGQAFLGSSVQEFAGYNSGAITVGASWKIY